MKRYNIWTSTLRGPRIDQTPDGTWVKWDDVQELIQTLKESRDLIEGVCEEYRAYRPLLNKIDKVLNNIEGTN